MNEEEAKAMLYLIAFGRDMHGYNELYTAKVQIIKELVDRQQEEITEQNKVIKKLTTVIAEIAEREDIEGEIIDILDKYL